MAATRISSQTTRRAPWRAVASAVLLASLVTACDRQADRGAVVVSVVGPAPVAGDPARVPLSMPARVLMGATAQGLVALDAAGQVEPALAERWIVTDEGMSYIFRLRDAQWADGGTVAADEVVRLLRRQLARASRNPLKAYLSAIDDIVAMTPQVIEIRLSRPRPDLLKLFAQPEMRVARARDGTGAGPFRIAVPAPAPLLTPIVDRNRAADEVATPLPKNAVPEDDVRLIGEPASRAILRFTARRSDLMLGGTIADWPMLSIAGVAPADIRIDPAAGLFGLAIVRRDGLLRDAALRDALSMAFDRAALTAAVAAEWSPADHILPGQLDSAALPTLPAWTAQPLAERRAEARRRIADWQRANGGEPPVISVHLPAGPGMTESWGRIARTLLDIGVLPVRAVSDAADLRLIDAVAPYDSARWYLATACAPCGEGAAAAVEAARIAPTIAARAAAIAAADAAVAADVPFIPLARPFRWSLVAARLRAWQPNARAWHPLNHLRRATN